MLPTKSDFQKLKVVAGEDNVKEFPYLAEMFRMAGVSEEALNQTIAVSIGVCPNCHESLAKSCVCMRDD